jgi:glycosyltransferase involved in cell wall biosynthesis
LAVIEAGAAKLPVVCTRTCGLREVITDGVTGRLVGADDEDALTEAITNLLVHPEEAARLGTALNEYVKNHLTWVHTYEKYLHLSSAGVRQ